MLAYGDWGVIMLNCNENLHILMDAGDWGAELPFELSGDVEATDTFVFCLAAGITEPSLLVKTLTLTKDNLCFLSFTETESAALPAGTYRWSLKQFRDGQLLNTVVSSRLFEIQKGVQING